MWEDALWEDASPLLTKRGVAVAAGAQCRPGLPGSDRWRGI